MLKGHIENCYISREMKQEAPEATILSGKGEKKIF